VPEKSSPTGSPLDLLEYPSRFPLKVFGNKSAQFEGIVLKLVKARCPQAEFIEVTERQSKEGKYTALTLTFTVHSRQQLEDIYQDLYECEQVVMSL